MVLLRKVTSADGSPVAGQIRIKKMYINGSGIAVVALNGGGTSVFSANTAAAADLNIDFRDDGLFLNGHQFTTVTNATIYLYG